MANQESFECLPAVRRLEIPYEFRSGLRLVAPDPNPEYPLGVNVMDCTRGSHSVYLVGCNPLSPYYSAPPDGTGFLAMHELGYDEPLEFVLPRAVRRASVRVYHSGTIGTYIFGQADGGEEVRLDVGTRFPWAESELVLTSEDPFTSFRVELDKTVMFLDLVEWQ